MKSSIDFAVARDDFARCKFIETALPAAADLPGDALLVEVGRFAFTANNITYAMLGDQLKYWQLFPGAGWLWQYSGLGHRPGDRLEASAGHRRRIAVRLFSDGHASCHRGCRRQQARPARRRRPSPRRRAGLQCLCAGVAGRQGDYQALLRPLFMLSFLVDDHLAEADFYGACSVILSSASSKTAFGLAHLLSLRKQVRVIGLTSAANADFVKSLGCYDEVVTYDEVSALPSDQPVAFVDMAGNGQLRAKLHRHFGDRLTYSGRIGLTHRNSSDEEPDLPGARPAWLFAPDQIRMRAKEWGAGGVDRRFGGAWSGFAPKLDRWINVIEGRGQAAVKQIYLDTLDGRVAPNRGHILSLAE